MKKRFMIPAAIAALMGVGAYFGHATATPADTSDLLLDNAEALASDDEGEPVRVDCYGNSSECARISTSPGQVHIFYKS